MLTRSIKNLMPTEGTRIMPTVIECSRHVMWLLMFHIVCWFGRGCLDFMMLTVTGSEGIGS
jgi:hypothetical protein